MRLVQAVKSTAGASVRKLATMTRVPRSTIHRYVNFGHCPRGQNAQALQSALAKALHELGFSGEIEFPTTKHIRWAEQVVANERLEAIDTKEIELMQLDRSVLAHFGLRMNPFINDVETDTDVFVHKGLRTIEAAIRDTIDERGFLAICAPSGAGKTTIWDGIESEYANRDDVVFCRPQIKRRENLDPEHLTAALIYGINGEDTKVRRSCEERGRQLSQALRMLRSANDRKAVLYIDDAHFCNASVLRQLKTFYEEKIGRFRLLAIILVGLPTLKEKLTQFPEIGNRIRLIEVPPVPVAEYLQFKLKRVGSSLDKLFDEGGKEAFLERFKQPRRPAFGYPLLINAQCIRAMCQLYANGAQPGERITRAIVDELPGAYARRIAS